MTSFNKKSSIIKIKLRQIWRLRMSEKIKLDAEDIKTKNEIISIGGKIKKKLLNTNLWD